MLIDWFTVGAQAFNFLVLVWLMKRYLYKPILDAIDTREKRISSQLADAKKQKGDANRDREDFEAKIAEFDKQRAALFSKATDEAKVQRQRLLDEAQSAADVLSESRRKRLQTEAINFEKALHSRVQHAVFDVARKTLNDLAAESLEERVGDAFVNQLAALEGSAKDDLTTAVTKIKDSAIVRSAFELPAKQRSAIQKALADKLSTQVAIRYETSPDLISGIELVAGGQKISWNISDYLTAMEKDVAELAAKEAKPAEAHEKKSKAAPKTEPKVEASVK